MPAQILQHPKAPVMSDPPPPDPREQAVLPRYEALTPDQMVVLDAQDAIERLADRLGSYRRLMTVVRNLAAIHGERV